MDVRGDFLGPPHCTTTRVREMRYVPEEKDTFIKCRELGISHEYPFEDETRKAKWLRKRRNMAHMKTAENTKIQMLMCYQIHHHYLKMVISIKL